MDTESTSPLPGTPATTTDQRVGRMVELLLDLLSVKKQDLAARIGMSPQNLSKKINGSNPWTVREIEQVAAALGFPVSLLHVDPEEVAEALRTPGRSINYRSA